VIATWGESGSTDDTKTPGLILDGTEKARAVLLTANLEQDDFACGGDYDNIKSALGGLDTIAGDLYLELDDTATIKALQ
jgi:hypothetical protein